jgi:hypothetical protein
MYKGTFIQDHKDGKIYKLRNKYHYYRDEERQGVYFTLEELNTSLRPKRKARKRKPKAKAPEES